MQKKEKFLPFLEKQPKNFGNPKEIPNYEKIIGILEKIIAARKEYKPDIPAEKISGKSPDNKYRVRKNYFQIITLNLEFLCQFLPENYTPLIQEVKSTVKYFYQDKFRDRFTTQEDLDKLDGIIKKVFSTLEYPLPED